MFVTTPVQAAHLTLLAGVPAPQARLVEGQPGETLWAPDGQLVASYGALLLGHRRGTAWMALRTRAEAHPIPLVRHVLRLLRQVWRDYALQRLDVVVHPCDARAVALAEYLGFQWEARLECYGPSGETMDQYVLLQKERV